MVNLQDVEFLSHAHAVGVVQCERQSRIAHCEEMLCTIVASESLVPGDRYIGGSTWLKHVLAFPGLCDEESAPSRVPVPTSLSPRSSVETRNDVRLTRRELDVLHLLAAGQSNREIGHSLFLSIRTVERHIENLYRKIGARNRAEATAFALRHRLA